MASRPLSARAAPELSRVFSDDLHSSSSPTASSSSVPFYESNYHGALREPASQTGERPGSGSITLQEAMARSRSLLDSMEAPSPSSISSSSRRPFSETPNEYLDRRTRSIAEAHRNILSRGRRRTDHARAFFERERNADHRRLSPEVSSFSEGQDQSSRTATSSVPSETVTPQRLRMVLPRYTPTAEHPRQEQSRSIFVTSDGASQAARSISPLSDIGPSRSRPGEGLSADWVSGSRSTAAVPSAMKRSFEERSGWRLRPTPRVTTEEASSDSERAVAGTSGSGPLRVGRPLPRPDPTRLPWSSPSGEATPKRRRSELTAEHRISGPLRATPQIASTSRAPMTATSLRSSSPSRSNLANRMTAFPPALGLSSEDPLTSNVIPSPAASDDDPPFLVEEDMDSQMEDDDFDTLIAPLVTSGQHTPNASESTNNSMPIGQSPLTNLWTSQASHPSSNAHFSSTADSRGTFIYHRFSQQLETLQTQIEAARAEVLRLQNTYQGLREISPTASGSTQAQWHLNQTRVLLERSRDQLDSFRSILSGRQPSMSLEAESLGAEVPSGVAVSSSDGGRTTTPLQHDPPSLPLIRSNSPLVTPFTEHEAIEESRGGDLHSFLRPSSSLLSEVDRRPWMTAARSRLLSESARWSMGRPLREQGNAALPSALRYERRSRPTSAEIGRSRQAGEAPAPRPDLSRYGFSGFGTILTDPSAGSNGAASGSMDSPSSRLPSQDRPSALPRRQWPYTPIGSIPMLSAGSPGLRNEPLDFATLHSQEAAEIEEMQARTSLEEERLERQQQDGSRPTSNAETHSPGERMMASIWREFDHRSVGEVLAHSEASSNEPPGGQLRDVMRGPVTRETAGAAPQTMGRAESGRQTYQQMMDSLWPSPNLRRVQRHSPRVTAQRTPVAALSGEGRYGIDGSVGIDASDSGRTPADALLRRSRYLFGDNAPGFSGTGPTSDNGLRSGELNHTDLFNLRSSRPNARLATMTASTTTTTTTTTTSTTRAPATDRPEIEREDVDVLLRRLNMPAGLEESLLGFMDDSWSEGRRGASEATLQGLRVFSYESRYAHLLAERERREESAGHKGKARAIDDELTAQLLQGADGAFSSSSSPSECASSSSSPSPSAASASGSGSGTESACPDQCPICLEEYEGDHKMAACWCEHEFHETCLKTWLKQTKSCPLCRSTEPGTVSGSGSGGDGLRGASGGFARFFLPDFDV